MESKSNSKSLFDIMESKSKSKSKSDMIHSPDHHSLLAPPDIKHHSLLLNFEHRTMINYGFSVFYCLFSILILTLSLKCSATDEDRQAYIVYMGSLPEGEYLPSSHHLSLLQEVIEGSSVADSLIRSYKRSFNGFAAKLTDREGEKLASMKEVVSVFPSRTLQLHTTRSWDFMGFNHTVKRNLSLESDIIVGIIDTGIWPESPSFNDEGFGPTPKKWKGTCKGGTNFTCNKKIIGARYYTSNSSNSARDNVGHGTHTASTAAGNKVKDASFFGLAQGTARGGVPSARIAAYKVCDPESCDSADVLAAFDDAIADGVDVITISIGSWFPEKFDDDTIAIGAFHASANGILTVNSAGNGGNSIGSVTSVAPWMLSVAASSTDRLIIDKVVLGNGKTLIGYAVNSFTLNGKKFPLIYGKDVSDKCIEADAKNCVEGCVDSEKVKGKIVLCDVFWDSLEPYKAGALGAIYHDDFSENVSAIVPMPALPLSGEDYDVVMSYMDSTKKAEASILRSDTIKDFAAPVVAPFSSRGPNAVTLDILKPDVTAPGVDILAAYPPTVAPVDGDKRRVDYNILSGTSMSCPHTAGVAAYVKSIHPDWSPSAIQSAIMTTAHPMSVINNPDAEFAYGSGHINPVNAINPGLVYEASKKDYISMLCGMGYAEGKIRLISGDNSTCPEGNHKMPPRDLNYPSLTAFVSANKSFTIKFHRTVTNVGLPTSTYKAKVSSNPKLKITVAPQSLSFKSLNETKSFDVTVVGDGFPEYKIVSATLEWSDRTHSVRSPIVMHTYFITL